MAGLLRKLTPFKDGVRRKMMMRKLTSVALVARGSNDHAEVTFFKSKDKPVGEVKKKAFLTSVEEDHSHVVSVSEFNLFNGGETGWQDDHYHPYIVQPDGTIMLGIAEGHTHTVEGDVQGFLKSSHPDKKRKKNSMKKEDTIVPTEAEKLKKAQDDKVTKLESDLKTALLMLTMTDAHKTFHAALDEKDQDAFVAKSVEDRDAVLKEAEEADAVVFKSADGTVYRTSDGPRVVAMAKQLDKLAKDRETDTATLVKEREISANLVYKNRAELELANLPGTTDTHITLLKSIDSITDKAQREAALSVLKAQNTALAPAFTTVGTSEVSKEIGDAVVKMDTLTDEYVAKNPDVDRIDAYEIIAKAHPKVYEQAVG